MTQEWLSSALKAPAIPGQMDLDACIADAEKEGSMRQNIPVDPESPVQKARMRAAAVALKTGKQKIALCCRHCHSESIYEDGIELATYICAACGRKTPIREAHNNRRRAMQAFIRQGIDLDMDRRARA